MATPVPIAARPGLSLPPTSARAILGAMAYEITATRKRPQSFGDLAGQEFVSATLKASIATGRIAHAYLFSGPRGCGKTSTARILARSLNCERGPTAEPCGVCDSCASIARGAALDVIEIDGASNTSVDNVRQIKDEVLFPPNSSKHKIYIIDEVHMLSNSAFNALLKTIEEPPPYIVFIFATTELHKVPATIKSRCQQFNFRLIDLETIKARLKSAADDLGIEADDDALLWIAREATGSLRDAYTLFDQVASFSDGRIRSSLIRDKLGLVGSERLGALMERAVAGDRSGALALLDEALDAGVSVEQFAHDAVGYARGLLMLKAGIERESLLGHPRSAFPPAVVGALSQAQAERMLAGLLDLYRDMRYSVNPRWELELAVARLCSIRDYIDPAELARTVGRLKAAIADGAAPGAPSLGAALARTEAATAPGMSPGSTPGTAQVAAASPAAAAPNAAAAPVGRQAATIAPPDDDLLDGGGYAADGRDGPAGSDGPDEARGAPDDGLDGAALKAAVVGALAKSKLVLSMCLERSGAWFVEGDRLVIPCANGYDASTVLGEAAAVAKRVADLSGRSLKVEPRAAEQAAPREAPARPSARDESDDDAEDEPGDPAAIVERVFRGRRIEPRRRRDGGGYAASADGAGRETE